MSSNFLRTCCPILVASASLVLATPAWSQSIDETVRTHVEEQGDLELQMAFENAPWRDVVKWLADSSGLALHLNEVPVGSFTYSDPKTFTPDEAIARVNLFLLPQGFTLIRSNQLLLVINLSDPRGVRQLDALARSVTLEDLAELRSTDVVKCFFPLQDIDADTAVEELAGLNLMLPPAVFERTNQLLVTDTVAKLRNVQKVLTSLQPNTVGHGVTVRNFALKHVNADDLLVVVRPHLGLATDEMIGIDISLSADPMGKNVFVTGVEDRVRLIEGLIEAIDVPEKSSTGDNAEAILKSYRVEGGNVELTYNILQTLLAGRDVRLSTNESDESIVAFATADVHNEIAQTVEKMQGANADFEIISLTSADPYQVVSLVREMLNLPDPFDDDRKGRSAEGPRIDADPEQRRLFVRGKKHEIEQIRKIVSGLDVPESGATNSRLRVFPLTGKRAEQVLDRAARFWRQENPIFLHQNTRQRQEVSTERVLTGSNDPSTVMRVAALLDQPVRGVETRLLSGNAASEASEIRCEVAPAGLLLHSEDTAALEEFENHLRLIAGRDLSQVSEPIVFYLKYTKPKDALRMLAELLDGGVAAEEATSGALVSGVTTGESYLGSIVTSQDGTTTMMAGSITVVADPRLNRLIAQGTTTDIEQIEDYLTIIDKDRGITSVETYGSSHVIDLKHTTALEVASVIREAYSGRVNAAAKGQTGPASEKADKKVQKTAATSKTGNSAAESREPKMTIAVHEPSNSLIVTAPDQLFREVEALARVVDERSRKTVEIVTVPNAREFESTLQSLMSGNRSSRQKSR